MFVVREHHSPLPSRLCHLCFNINATVTNQPSKKTQRQHPGIPWFDHNPVLGKGEVNNSNV